MQAERAAHGDDQLTDTKRVGITDFRVRKIACRQVYKCEVRCRIVADYLRVDSITVGGDGQQSRLTIDYMAVGQSQSVSRYHEARAGSATSLDLVRLHADHRRRHGLHDAYHGLRVRIEQLCFAR
jgi:hypothetical protein